MGNQQSLCPGPSIFNTCELPEMPKLSQFPELPNAIKSFKSQSNLTKEEIEQMQNLQTFRLSDLKQSILKSNSEKNLFNSESWSYILSKFQKYYFDSNEKEEFLDLINSILDINYGHKKVEKQTQACQYIAKKIQKFENTLHWKHRYLNNYCYYVWSTHYNKSFVGSKFDLNRQEIQRVSKRSRQFCNQNLKAFSYISFYFRISLENTFNKNTDSSIKGALSNLQKSYLSQIQNLEKLYPASNQKDQKGGSFNLSNISFKQNFEILTFQNGSKSNYNQLVEFIIQKSGKAKNDIDAFKSTVKDICYQKGYGFKYGVKIKSSQSKSAISRTIQKLLTKQQIQKNFKKSKNQLYTKFQDGCLKSGKISLSLNDFVEEQVSFVKQKIKQIMDKEEKVEFNIKDLIRGKCTFDRPEDIVATVEKLKQNISRNGHKILELKNRLGGKTKDLVLIIQLPNSIAELQLVLRLDVAANEFNHKIYELARSQIYSPLTNLFIQNDQWAGQFFTEIYQSLQELSIIAPNQKMVEGIGFSETLKMMTPFKKNFLQKYGIVCKKSAQIVQKQARQVSIKLKDIQSKLKQTNFDGIDCQKRKTNQVQNQINLYVSFYDYKKAYKIIETIPQNQLSSNKSLLLLKANSLRDRFKFVQSEPYYQKLLKQVNHKQDEEFVVKIYSQFGRFYEKSNKLPSALTNYKKGLDLVSKKFGKQSDQASDFYQKIASVYHKQCDFQKALQSINQAKNIKEKLFGKQDKDLISILNVMGGIYVSKGDCSKASEILNQSVALSQKLVGKQSVEIASAYTSLADITYLKGQFAKSIEQYKKVLQIYTKVLGIQCSQLSVIYGRLGMAYQVRSYWQDAIVNFKNKIFIQTKISGQQSASSAKAYDLLAGVYALQKERSKTLEFYKKALKIRETLFGKQSIQYAETIGNMAKAYRIWYQNDESKKLFEQAIPIYEKIGIKDDSMAMLYSNYAVLLLAMKKDKQALNYFNRSYQIFLKKYGSDNHNTKASLIQIEAIKKKKQ